MINKNELYIEVSNLSKDYNDAHALIDVSFSLKKGEVLGLLGPNGAGKTTAIHILLGLLTPTSGKVSVLGLDPLKKRDALAPLVNFSSAYTQLPTNLTVEENMNFFSMLYNVKDKKTKIKQLLELFEISHLKKHLTGALSSGEKTRVNLCKCFLNDPILMLLDEPTASLDPEAADKTRMLIKMLQQERSIGILYTSHNMPEVEEICDRAFFIYEGKIITEGRPKEIIRNFGSQSLEEVFIKIVRGADGVRNSQSGPRPKSRFGERLE